MLQRFTRLVKSPDIILVPAFFGFVGGGITVGFDGFMKTKNDSFTHNMSYTAGCMIIGSITGGIIGAVWPFTTTMYIGRLIYKNK